jgi:hypothetical protein
MKTFPARLACLTAIVVLASVGQGFAQGGPYGPPSGPPGPSGPPAPTAADQARQLRGSLALRPDQEPALQAYIQAVIPSASEAARLRQTAADAQSLTTPQRLDQMLARMDEMRSVMVNRVQATKRFYFQLTPAQQHAFDNLRPPGQPQRPGT